MPAYDADGCNRECTDFSKSLAQASLMASQGIPLTQIFLFLHTSSVRQAEGHNSHLVFANDTDPWPGTLIQKAEGGDGMTLTAQAPNGAVGRAARENIVRFDVDEPLPAGGTNGDMAYHNGTGWVLLDIVAKSILIETGGIPKWLAGTQGQLMYHNGTTWLPLSAGTTLQQLRMNAAATAPEWFTAPSATALVPTGGMIDFGGLIAPTGWLLCDGTAYHPVNDYPALFAVIGTAYGGNGTTTFNVPNDRGMTTRGLDARTDGNEDDDYDVRGIAQNSNSEGGHRWHGDYDNGHPLHQVGHTHAGTGQGGGGTAVVDTTNDVAVWTGASGTPYTPSVTGELFHGGSHTGIGANDSTDNRGPYIVHNRIIKT